MNTTNLSLADQSRTSVACSTTISYPLFGCLSVIHGESFEEYVKSICSHSNSLILANRYAGEILNNFLSMFIAVLMEVLKPLDPQGFRRQGKVYMEKLIEIFDRIFDQRLQARSESSYDISSTGDVLDSLLVIQKDESLFSLNNIRHLFLDLFVAGTDTTSTTVEWAMAELIRNPEKMEKARIELENVINGDDGIVQESDISKLPYLQAIVKETLRLHPSAPFLVPWKATHDVKIRGLVVPKDAQILCNVWAIGRDSRVWSLPEMFTPERFLGSEIDYRGQDYELVPFGSGRRICPGLPLAYRMLHMMLGSLICKFDWKVDGEEIDMNEKFGLTLRKDVPLVAIPTPTKKQH